MLITKIVLISALLCVIAYTRGKADGERKVKVENILINNKNIHLKLRLEKVYKHMERMNEFREGLCSGKRT